MEKLGVGIVGIGHAGREHFKAFEENPYAEVRAVWAPSRNRLDLFPGPDNLFASSYEAVLDREDIDMISLCSPNYAHADQAVMALEAGKHVICEKPLDCYTFAGSPSEVGRAQGALDPAYVQEELKERLKRPHSFDHPYFRENIAFMRREFPEFTEEMEAFGEAAGLEGLDQIYFIHIYHTGPEEDGCSALGLLLEEDGPAMLATNDVCHPGRETQLVAGSALKVFSDVKNHGFLGLGDRSSIAVWRAVNDVGLMLGSASGHPKFHWADNPEHINLYFQIRLLAQYCGDCDDIRHFLNQYRISGVKGINATAVDARGNILGIELESENIAFREPEDGVLMEVNHWQHPDLQEPSREPRADFWQGKYYYNSQNRVQYLAYHRERFRQMKTLDELIGFSFDVHAPGRLLQMGEYNIEHWVTFHAVFMRGKDRKMRVYTCPLDKAQYTEAEFPEAFWVREAEKDLVS